MPNTKKAVELRIHGDNIVECRNALNLICDSFNISHNNLNYIDSPLYSPIYNFVYQNNNYNIRLLPGYGRWGFELVDYLNSKGAILREAADAIITKVEKNKDNDICERPLLAIEFSGALPAGNNAWQRCGRALALARAKIPYLYYAELGGVELDQARNIKAPRFPNPIVPFSYLLLGQEESTISLPVYEPSPSIDEELKNDFANFYGLEKSHKLVKDIILEQKNILSSELEKKALGAVIELSKKRKRNDILEADKWADLFTRKTSAKKAKFFLDKKMEWKKKVGIKNLNKSFTKLLEKTPKLCVAVGSKDLPICLISKNNRKKFAKLIKQIYKKNIDIEFLNWLSDNKSDLICVWIAGFKPRGDDSRPDRGLTPLARMIFGKDNIDLLSIIYGPAKKETWSNFPNNIYDLANANGLWEAIVGLSDAIITDSPTGKNLKQKGTLVETKTTNIKISNLPIANTVPSFGEHDIDSILHLLFYNQKDKNIHEAMCNPPGGDWSGISIIDFDKNTEYRWTSLPRVSSEKTKRPDHLTQFRKNNVIFSVESKYLPNTLEDNIGPRLISYTKNLIINHPPIAKKKTSDKDWNLYKGETLDNDYKIISGSAFKYVSDENLVETKERGNTDIAIGIDFVPDKNITHIHLLYSDGNQIALYIKESAKRFNGKIKTIDHTS